MEEEDYINQKDEEEETLSFCDLPNPIYNNGTDDYSVSVSSSSIDDSEMDTTFEFLSRDTSIGSSEKSVIFCGKLITYKESEQFRAETTDARGEEESKAAGKRRSRRWSLFRSKPSGKSKESVDGGESRRRFASSNNSKKDRSSNSKSTSLNIGIGKGLLSDEASSWSRNCGFSVRKPSSSSSSSSSTRLRSRWNMIMFGSSSSGAEMELSDIRRRQKRRNPAAGGIVVTAPSGSGGEEKRKSANGGLWSLIQTLSCSSGLAVSALVPVTGFHY